MSHRGFTPILILFAIVTLAAGAVGFVYLQNQTIPTKINSYEDCVKAGYPATMSYPSQCNTPDGRHFVQQLSEEEKKNLIPPTPPPAGGPTANPTAGWKTYTNTKYNYSLKYSPDYILQDKGNYVKILQEPYQEGNPYISILQKENPNNLKVEEWLREHFKNGGSPNFIDFNGHIMPEFDTRGSDGKGSISIYLENENKIYEISVILIGDYPEKTKQTVDQILSTFQFLEPDSGQYSCPQNGWVNCMPILTEEGKKACTKDAIIWYRKNCPDFKGVAG
jgi:hypothetical protein